MTDKLLIDAVEYALSRDVVPSDEYYNKMTAIQRRQAVSIAGLAEVEQIKHVINQVNKALADGQDFDEFKKTVKLKDIELPEYRLKTIYQTNIQQAYAHGRWFEQQRNKKKKPYLRYVAVNDSRTRPSHRALHGTVRPIDDDFWATHTPPMDYNCRCRTVAIDEQTAKDYGITGDNELPNEQPADGFGHTPKDYNKRFNKLVNERISELMIEHYKQASVIGRIKDKVTSAVSKFLKKPVAKLAVLIASAKELLNKDNEDE